MLSWIRIHLTMLRVARRPLLSFASRTRQSNMRSAATHISSWAAIVHQQEEVNSKETQLTPKEFLLRHESGIYSTARTIKHKVYDLDNHLARLGRFILIVSCSPIPY